jgi:hypothetical protein
VPRVGGVDRPCNPSDHPHVFRPPDEVHILNDHPVAVEKEGWAALKGLAAEALGP